jgi:hypothetical protein
MSDRTTLVDNSAIVSSGNFQTILVEPENIVSMEFEDVLFNLNSAVLLPYRPQQEQLNNRRSGLNMANAQSGSLQHLITGIGVIYSVYRFIELFPDYKIIIAGHTDTSGGIENNFRLSELRANNVLYLLLGKKNEWADTSFEKHTAFDIQSILKHYSEYLNWNCDPGPVDGIIGNKTKNALKSFQESFNANKVDLGLDDYSNIPVKEIENKKLNKETWEAIYGLYIYELSKMLNCTASDSDFEEYRSSIKFMKDDCKILACGESFPIAETDRPNTRCQANRRVEILFSLEEDIPDYECLSSRSEIYTYEDCPFYNPARYRRNYIDRHQNFVADIELQTVSPTGLAFGNVDLVLHHQNELVDDIELTTDDTGYWRRNNIPSGIYDVLYPDGSPVIYEFEEEEIAATIDTSLVNRFISRIIIDRAFNEEERNEFQTHRQIYRRTAGQTDGAIEGRGGESAKPRRSLFYTNDNIALAAGWNSDGDAVNIPKLIDTLDEWLNDYYPIIKQRGYKLTIIVNRTVKLYDDRKNLKGNYTINNDLKGALGAYSAFQHRDGLFLDMTNHSSIIQIIEHEDEMLNLTELMNESDAQRYGTEFDSMGNKFDILYRMPDANQLVYLCLTGGMGKFEDYTSDENRNRNIHQRNLAVANTISIGYPALLRNYIRSVETAMSEDEIRALGPPPEPYQFPKPIGATTDQYIELLNELKTSSFRAWLTIAQRLDVLAGRIPDGTLFFRVKFSVSERVEAASTSPYDEVKVEWNFDITEHGVFEKRTTTNTAGIQIGGGSGRRQVGVGADHEIDLETGEAKSTVKAKIGNWGIEASDDGTQKVTGPFGISSEGNLRRGEMGFGGTLSTHDLFKLLRERRGQEVADDAFRNIPNAELYLGLHFQGLREDNILAVVSRAPGFFERRSVTNLIAQTTQWTDLNLDEKTHLESLGWNMDLWDRKYFIPLSDFPESCRTNPFDLQARQRIAIVHLGIRDDEWLNIWRSIAGS